MFKFFFWIILFYFIYKIVKTLIKLVIAPFRSSPNSMGRKDVNITYAPKATVKSQDVVDVEFIEMVDEKKDKPEDASLEKDKNG